MTTSGSTHTNPIASRPARAPARFRPIWLLPWLVFAASLAATYLLCRNAEQNAVRALQADFDYRVNEASDHVMQRMATYEQVLRGAGGLFAASENVERNEFRDYVAKLRLDENYPGIQGMGFALVVPPVQKDRHIAAIRGQGFPAYNIHPGGEREIYTSVIYIEPFNERNQRAFGYDMYSDLEHPRAGDSAPGLRRAAMEQARDSGRVALSGRAVISGKVRLLMEMETDRYVQAGFLMYFPIYRNGAPVGTLAGRRANIIGWAYAPFRMDDLMGGILAEHTAEVDIEIFDGEEMSVRTLMYDDDKIGRTDAPSGPGSMFHTVRRLDIAGHAWTMAIHSMPGLEINLDKEKTQFIAYAGIGMSLLLALFTWLLVHDRESAMQFARQINESRERINLLNEQLALTLKELESIMNTFPDLHYVINMKGELIRWNRSLENFLGLAHEAILNRQATKFICEEDRAMYAKGVADVLEKGTFSTEVRYIRHDGAHIPFLCNGAVLRNENGETVGLLAACRDIGERKAAEECIQHMAHYDLLTDLPNRAMLADRLQQALSKAKRDKTHVALMFLDLDMFKPVNDTLGHDIGDLLLKEVAKHLQNCMRESDTAARVGGDEFIVLLPHIEAEQDALVVAEKILHALNQPFDLAGHSLHISASIGIAIYPEHGSDGQLLTRNADIAMYHAKKSGRNNVKFYRYGMQESGELTG